MSRGNYPAYPRPASVDPTQGTVQDGDRPVLEQDGLTRRDRFALELMGVWTSIVESRYDDPDRNREFIHSLAARLAVAGADSLMEELDAR